MFKEVIVESGVSLIGLNEPEAGEDHFVVGDKDGGAGAKEEKGDPAGAESGGPHGAWWGWECDAQDRNKTPDTADAASALTSIHNTTLWLSLP
jgi:hypothetical protein